MFKFKEIEMVKKEIEDLKNKNEVLESKIFNLEYPDGKICFSYDMFSHYLIYKYGIRKEHSVIIPHLKVDKWAVDGDMLYIESENVVNKYVLFRDVAKIKKVNTETPEELNWHE